MVERKHRAMATAAQVTSRERARGRALATLPTARTMPVAISAIPRWCSTVRFAAIPVAKSATPGTNVQKLAWPARTERSGAPSATGSSW